MSNPDYRTDVPLYITYNPPGDLNGITPHVHILVNNVPCDVVFDTGSNGLVLLQGALHGASIDTDQEALSAHYGFGNGELFLQGSDGGATFAINGLSSTGTIRFMRLLDSSAAEKGPWSSITNLSAWNNPHFRGLNGILGVGLRPGGTLLGSPLAQLPGNASFIVEFPLFHQTQGHVIVNPHAADLTGFTMFNVAPDSPLLPNGLESWNDFAMQGTIMINGKSIQLETLLDTGSPLTELYSTGLPFYGVVPAGNDITMLLTDPKNGNTMTLNSFIVSNPPTIGIDYVRFFSSTTPPYHMSFGTNLFFSYDVYFDQKNGRIGIRLKQPV